MSYETNYNSAVTFMFVHRYEVSKRKVRNKKVGESSKLKYKVKKETKVFSMCTCVLKINCVNLNS